MPETLSRRAAKPETATRPGALASPLHSEARRETEGASKTAPRKGFGRACAPARVPLRGARRVPFVDDSRENLGAEVGRGDRRGVRLMEEEDFVKAKRAEGQDLGRGWSPGAGQLLVLAVSALLIIAAIVVGLIGGLVFAIPLAVLALMIPVITMRGGRGAAQQRRACPHCGATVEAPEHIAETDCPRCKRQIEF